MKFSTRHNMKISHRTEFLCVCVNVYEHTHSAHNHKQWPETATKENIINHIEDK